MWVDRDIRDIDRWLEKTGTAPTLLGAMVSNNPNLVFRLRRGNSTLKSLRRALKFIKKYPNGK